MPDCDKLAAEYGRHRGICARFSRRARSGRIQRSVKSAVALPRSTNAPRA